VSGYLTDREVARLLRKHPRTIQRWCQSGKLRCRKVGRSWRIPPRAVREAELDAELVDGVERDLRAATLVCGDLRKEWIDLGVERAATGRWPPSTRDWKRIALHVELLRGVIGGLPGRADELPEPQSSPQVPP
jgi:excisionase family DNA binding protein